MATRSADLFMHDAPPGVGWLSMLQGAMLSRFVILCLAIWLHAASSLLAATTLPSAIEEFGGAHLVGWAFMLYQLGSILAGAAAGLLVARAGLRVGMLAGAICYALGSVVCALAPDMSLLLSGRLLQGAGGGGLVALVYVALNRLFPAQLMPRLIALTSAIWTVSAFCGPLVGGSFASLGYWRVAYWAFALQALVFALAVLVMLSSSGEDNRTCGTPVPVARLGLIALAVACIAVAGVHIDPVVSPALCLLGLALFASFLRIDRGCATLRMFPSDAFTWRGRPGVGLIMVFAGSTATMSFMVYGPFFLETLYGVSPLAAGYIVALEALGWGAAALVFSSASERAEARLIRCGSLLVSVGVAGLALAVPAGVLGMVVLLAVCQGAGFGMMWGFVIRRIVAGAPAGQSDVASSAIPTTQQIGFAVGAAASSIVANAAGFDPGASAAGALASAFWVFAAFVPLALLASVAGWRLSR